MGSRSRWWPTRSGGGTADAYLATPVRIAEILAGGALAIAVRRRPVVARLGIVWPVAALVGVVAVASVGESDWVVTRGFPAAISLAWVALIAATLHPGAYARVLAAPWLRWVGLRSYAIYLIHWPLIELTDWSGPLVIAATLLIAEVSYRVVEDPIRRARVISRPIVTLVGLSVLVAFGLGTASARFDDDSFLVDAGFADDLPDWFTDDPQVSGAVEAAEAVDDPVPTTSTPAAVATPPVVVVLGDSTATQVAAGLRAYSDATQELAVIDRTTSGCSALVDELAEWRKYRVSFGYVGEFVFDAPCRVGLDATGVPADVAIIIDHGSVMADHERPDGTWASILDADLRDDLLTIYRARIDEAAAHGIALALTTAPVMVDDTGLLGEMDDPRRLAAYNALVRQLADQTPGVVVLEIGAVLDAAGLTGPFSRPDGLHLDLAGAENLSEQVLVPALLELAAAEAR